MLYATPDLDLLDASLLGEVVAMREELTGTLRAPRRWSGTLRRTARARAIRGSNSIEGINVALDDADAALDGDEPLDASAQVFAEIERYRQALDFALTMAPDPHFTPDAAALRSMHFMMLRHDLSKSPGQYRRSEIYVQDEESGEQVYAGPDPDEVPSLMAELAGSLAGPGSGSPEIDGAMAHLNLAMIHPFRDGNGRMARAAQTLVLARSGIAIPELSSVEEWLGASSEDYYAVLTATGKGEWAPENDASLWLSFMVRAHHLQAQTSLGRLHRAAETYRRLDEVAAEHALPERVLDALYVATLGYRIRRAQYVRQTGIDARTGTRDLARLVDLGLLRPRGETKGRHYLRGSALDDVVRGVAPDAAVTDPNPEVLVRLAPYRRLRGR